jgi:hypothetical protein
MSFAARLVPLVALPVAPFCAPAHASDYEVGGRLVCDTQGQVERFVAVFTGDAQAPSGSSMPRHRLSSRFDQLETESTP